MPTVTDPALDLTEKFKRKGYLDHLKQSILSDKINIDGNNETLENLIKKRVYALIREMVINDENLLFKNRGSTSALLEAQLFKLGYERISKDQIDFDKIIENRINNKALETQIKELLKEVLE